MVHILNVEQSCNKARYEKKLSSSGKHAKKDSRSQLGPEWMHNPKEEAYHSFLSFSHLLEVLMVCLLVWTGLYKKLEKDLQYTKVMIQIPVTFMIHSLNTNINLKLAWIEKGLHSGLK
jgi:hypothetical protein